MSRRSQPPGPGGLVVVDKPGGMTSHDVVARVRRLAGTRKVGHAGTLDPMAAGVLVVGVERATRLLGHLMLTEKSYDATIRLGATTTTDDAEGEVTATASTADVTEDAVRQALAGFVGEIAQVPTAVSAIKVDGKRAYQRVRDGEAVELKARRVTIHELVVHGISTSLDQQSRLDQPGLDVEVSVRCSSGTYIRAIARDLGAVLEVGGHLTALRRTAVGPFALDQAHTLEELAEDFRLVPLDHAARAGFPAVDLDEKRASSARYGRPIDLPLTELTALFAPDGQFLALYEPRDGQARSVAGFTG